MGDNREIQRLILEEQVIAEELKWALAATVWETRRLDAENEEMRQQLEREES